MLALATAVGMVAMLAGIALAANPATATLSNGAQLTVSIDSPATGTEFVGSSVDVPVAGKASIGVGAQDATIVYVMDFSGSTGGTPSGSTCGTILDCEKAFFVGEYGRMRTVAVAPDGRLWVTTSNRDGRGDPYDGDDRVLAYDPAG